MSLFKSQDLYVLTDDSIILGVFKEFHFPASLKWTEYIKRSVT